MPSRIWICLSLALGFALSSGSGYACNDFYVCAPDNPFRHTVENAKFTNLYLYPNPKDMSWDQSTADTLKQSEGRPSMTVQEIDGFVKNLIDSSFFFPATQYHLINIPSFLGNQKTVQSCVDPVLAFARSHSNVLTREVLADFVGCERGAGGNASDQVNVIMSPEFRATNDAHFTELGVTVDLSDQPATCPPPASAPGAFHTWQFGTANFTVIPTMCNATLDDLAKVLSHEMIELISNPAGFGYVHLEGGGDQVRALAGGDTSFLNSGELADICEPGGLKNPGDFGFDLMPHSSLHVARYWSNIDNSCQPINLVGTQDLLIDDLRSHRLGTGGGMTPELSYRQPFLHGQPDQALGHLVLYTKTDDDNLCHQSSLDLHVNLTGGRHSLDFFHINNVQNADSWDNHEDHAVNIPVPPGLKLGDIDSIHLHVQSGHCHDLFTDGDDGWNVNRIAIFGFLAPLVLPPPSPTVPPVAPTGCKVFGGGGTCGTVGFNCNPFPGLEGIVIASGRIGVGVINSAPNIGLINGNYLNEGTADVAVCATRGGLVSCGETIPDVVFGPRTCQSPPFHPPVCPHPLILCSGGCRPLTDPECRIR